MSGVDTCVENVVALGSLPNNDKPTAPVVRTGDIPGELVQLDQWIVWKYRTKPTGGWTKPPYSPHTGLKTDVTDAGSFASFEEALAAQKRLKADGIGFSLIAGGNIAFIDLDHCRDVDTERIDDWARAVLRRFPVSYVEVSPSGTGLHVIVLGHVPGGKGTKRPVTDPDAHPEAAIELYSEGRYATITGNVLDDGHRIPGDAQAEILALFTELNPDPVPPTAPQIHLISSEPIDITTRLDVARKATNGANFVALYDQGDLGNHKGDHSAADLALCSHLGFYLDYRPELIDTAFRASALMRPKWDRRHRHDGATYGQMTIEKVLVNRGDAYAPGKRIDAMPDLSADSFVTAQTPVTNEIIDRFMTAAELCQLIPEDPDWLARPYVVVHGITQITGQPKAGKSTLLGALVRAIAEGGSFLGHVTMATPVIYLTEQTPTTFREILERSGLADCPNVHVLSWHAVAVEQWPEVVRAAVIKAQRVGARLLIIDTLPQFAGIRGEAENNAGDALAAIQPVQAACGTGLAVIVVAHDRKAGGEVGSSTRGSSAYAGAVDIIVQLKKADGPGTARPTLRVLSALSRFDETPEELTIERMDDGTFVALEPKDAFETTRIQQAILECAGRSEADAKSLADFLDEIPKSKRPTVNKVLTGLVAQGVMRRVGEGGKTHPYRFFVAHEPGEITEMRGTPPKTPKHASVTDKNPVTNGLSPVERRTSDHDLSLRVVSPLKGGTPGDRSESRPDRNGVTNDDPWRDILGDD
jgi:putative DNA primase/helicase